jgi:hypothetical protein
VAREAQDIQDTYGSQGFQAIEAVLEDNGGSIPDISDLQTWESMGNMETIPVLQVPESDQTYVDDLYYTYETDLGIPTTVHLGPDMSVLNIDEYVTDPGWVW